MKLFMIEHDDGAIEWVFEHELRTFLGLLGHTPAEMDKMLDDWQAKHAGDDK